MLWLEDTKQIQVDPPKRPKKITGTRLAAILGLNNWESPFKTWCTITRTYEEPFEETKFTRAGKAIEPLQLAYLKKAYYLPSITTPEDVYGEDYFNKTFGDFFPENKIFGGMWDGFVPAETGDVDTIIECKTTRRVEDWEHDIPEYYAIQAASYAYQSNADKVIMIVSFLTDADYDNPENFRPTVENTLVKQFRVSERYGDFGQVQAKAITWWNNHVVTGLSPVFDGKQDKAVLDELRKTTLNPETDIEELTLEAEDLKYQIQENAKLIAPAEKRLKEINDILKDYAMGQFKDGDDKVEWKGTRYVWTLSKVVANGIDKERLERDGLLPAYTLPAVQYRLTTSVRKED